MNALTVLIQRVARYKRMNTKTIDILNWKEDAVFCAHWALWTAAGYQWSDDNVSKVYLGWRIARGMLP